MINSLLRGIAILAAVCAFSAFILFTDYTESYDDRFLPGTTLNGIDVSEDVPSAAVRKLEDSYQLEVAFRGGTTETLSGKDIGYHLADASEVEAALSSQNYLAYLKSHLNQKIERTLSGAATFDAGKLAECTASWPEMDRNSMTAPKNAYIQYRDNAFSIVPDQAGSLIDEKAFASAMQAAINQSDSALDLNASEGVYPRAEVTADSPALNADLKTLQSMSWNTVTYTLPSGKDQVLDPSTTMNWLSRNKNGKLKKKKSVWNAHIQEYVENLAESVDTVYKKHKFKTHSGKEIKLNATGYYGWRISVDDEVAQLKKDLKADQPVKRKPVYIQEEAADMTDNYGFGKNYVEVDLSSQHLWVYKKGKVILESDVVSGNQGKHQTPAGAYFILDKARNVTLRGPVVKKTAEQKKKEKEATGTVKTEYEWESPVSYWMPITYEGVGMHDANWRGAFGGSIWTYNGSHGCINLPVYFAPQIYDAVKVGPPVAVYY